MKWLECYRLESVAWEMGMVLLDRQLEFNGEQATYSICTVEMDE